VVRLPFAGLSRQRAAGGRASLSPELWRLPAGLGLRLLERAPGRGQRASERLFVLASFGDGPGRPAGLGVSYPAWAISAAVRDSLAISLFLGVWAAVWFAGWLTGVYFFTGSDLPAFIGGYLGCVSGAFVTYRAMGRLRPGFPVSARRAVLPA
jgi:hypothetical protein